jgi:RNA polymerase sigma-70 factor (ECF subfamily)
MGFAPSGVAWEAGMPDVTQLLSDVSEGKARAAETLLPLVYDQLRSLADNYLHRERAGHTLQPTALVHEAYMKLVDQSRVNWQGTTHFRAVAAQAMQRVLIDHARGKNRQKRGGDWRRITLHDAFTLTDQPELDAELLHEALERMRQIDERQARVVELRVFGGLSSAETSHVLDVSERTVERDWKMGLAWLRRELAKSQPQTL